MAKDPAFLFYPGDYLRDTQTLSEKSQVSYDRIMCEHMRNICISNQQLKFFTKRLNEEELEELMFVLKEVNGGYQIEWIAESIEKRRAYSDSRRKNREGKSHKKVKKTSKTYVEHMENENEIENIIEYLNKTIGSKYKTTTKRTISLINARLKEGFSESDFIKVIDVKSKSWMNDSKMNEYLRPETLFGNKFENYLNTEKNNDASARPNLGKKHQSYDDILIKDWEPK